MPDLPLPKPTPPAPPSGSPSMPSASSISVPPAFPTTDPSMGPTTAPITSSGLKSGSPVDTTTEADDELPPPARVSDIKPSFSSPPPSLSPSPTPAPISKTTNLGEPSSFPKPMVAQRPPAVVTALSSVSSNSIPQEKEVLSPAVDQRSNGVSNVISPDKSVGGAVPPSATPPATSQDKTAPAPPKMAQPKKSPLRFLPLFVGVGIFVLVIAFVAMKLLGGSSGSPTSGGSPTGSPSTGQSGGDSDQAAGGGTTGSSTGTTTPVGEPVVLEYWGLWEPNEVMEKTLKDFESKNPGVTVSYVKQNYQDYRMRLQTAIASRSGPDVFRFHGSWVPMLTQELAPMPSSVLTSSDFESAFYPVATEQLMYNNQIVGVPTMYDGLVLYYNKDIFATAGVSPPTTWAELRTIANTLTIKTGGEIERGGMAIGTANNVEHFSDILALLMLQNGAKLDNPNSAEARDALLFYTNFTTKDGVWNSSMPNSTVAFARGDVAMMLAPSWRGLEVAAMNPSLSFGTVPVPQLSDERLAWATYWAEGVNMFSENQEQAWNLVKHLSSSAGQRMLFESQSQARPFGTPYARTDLADSLAEHPVLAPILEDAPYAGGWYMSSYTHDAGINDQIIKYYEDAINGILAGESISDSLTTVSQGVSQVLQQYNVPVSQ